MLMKRDEASLKYDAINPHQVYKLKITTLWRGGAGRDKDKS
jgi:hypothetical protein